MKPLRRAAPIEPMERVRGAIALGEAFGCGNGHSNLELTVVGLLPTGLAKEFIMSMSIRLVAFVGLTAATTAFLALPYLTIN